MTISEINKRIQPQRELLLQHALYHKIQTVSHLQIFMQGHVYAVWDFMSLLKALQQKLTCTTAPWFASPNPETRYLINEIVLAEESDLSIDGRRLSHFEMYIEAMQASDANTEEVLHFIEEVRRCDSVFTAIEQSALHPKIKAFLQFSFGVIATGKSHEIAAAFTFGREDLIPDMFTEILKGFEQNFPQTDLSKLIYYFERHIELDADEHGPMAMKMIAELCGNDAEKWEEVAVVSNEALKRRIGLWEAIEEQIENAK
ncbi:DUF3050 domain-containing protein [Flavobacterium sp. HSC-61S13]|uniref:DUF3050 domain-containing protein n=1 Tax=Flavobacterium sp. HSC-61S13 TaxID=2910963 RepID=UPI00209EC030|nr:DUF3050 domain-containing protein [Flavobacterium sp. HSC-61S13]MCP1995348.1 hypothetical protein [Flavobacterium sp. HSC-61S13]